MASVLDWCRERRLQERGLASPRRVSLLFLPPSPKRTDHNRISKRETTFFPHPATHFHFLPSGPFRNTAHRFQNRAAHKEALFHSDALCKNQPQRAHQTRTETPGQARPRLFPKTARHYVGISETVQGRQSCVRREQRPRVKHQNQISLRKTRPGAKR